MQFVGSSHTAGQQIKKQSSSAFGGFHCNVVAASLTMVRSVKFADIIQGHRISFFLYLSPCPLSLPPSRSPSLSPLM